MSADRFKVKRGSTSAVNAYLPAQGEPVMDTTLNQLRIGDGTTLGGVALSLVASAIKLATARALSLTGDVTGSLSFDGSADSSAAVTLAPTGVSAGTYVRVTVDAKGRVTAGQTSALAIANGGTGSSTATTARTALGAAASGANSDITSLTGLTTALSIPQGGTGSTTASTARTALGLSYYLSPDTAYTNGGLLSLTHGLGATPSSVVGLARCVVGEGGWPVGAAISVTGLVVGTNTTVVYGQVASGGLTSLTATSGASFTLTPANWRISLKAEQ